MVTTVPPKENEPDADGEATFGSGLGVGFVPLGKRVVIMKGRDAKPLKIKRQRIDKNSER